jgi:hypothetical protein
MIPCPPSRSSVLKLSVRVAQGVPHAVPESMVTLKAVGCEVLTAVVMKSSIFWDITSCSLLKVLLAACLMLAYFSTLKMEATFSSETSLSMVVQTSFLIL